MKQEISLSLKQKQVLSQQQRESLLILSMGVQQLMDFMNSEAEENPVAEFCAVPPLRTVSYSGDEENDFLHNIPAPENTTPEDILMSQVPPSACDTKEKERIFRAISRSVDANGFLVASAEEIAAGINAAVPDVERCLMIMKSAMEPAGVCAGSLEECLLLQLERSGDLDKLLREIIQNHLRSLMRGKLSHAAKAMGISVGEVSRCLGVIRTLNPKPLNGLLGGTAQYIVPDIVLYYEDYGWRAELNDNWLESYGLNDYYVNMYHSTSDPELKEYLRQKIGRVKFIRDAVERRRGTLLAIAERLAVYQSDFFLKKGPLVPLTMNQLSEEIGVHTSTVSRAIKEKYIQYPFGVTGMRTLFTGGVPAGPLSGEVGSGEIKRRIKLIIDAEDKAKPLSDQCISARLGGGGIHISRRTVAKYREELGINGAYDRRYFP